MSRRRGMLSWGLIILVLALVAGAAYYVFLPELQPHTTIHLGDGVFLAQVANTDAKRQQGLSGTQGLRDDQALLFVYNSDGQWPIQAQNINYPIDIVWLDKDKKVVYIVKNVPPDSYSYDQFTPRKMHATLLNCQRVR